MKVLIGYDGSPSADAALDDLQRAGLPAKEEAIILMISEIWLPSPNDDASESRSASSGSEWISTQQGWMEKAATEAEMLGRHAKDQLQRSFPDWNITSESAFGSPSRGILARADDFKPDLIVVGSQGCTAISRILLGSISQKVLTEAQCSVRVARRPVKDLTESAHLIIGFDGLSGSQRAVEAVASRFWREKSEVRLLAVSDPVTPSLIGRFVRPIANLVEEINQGDRRRLEKLAAPALQKLKTAGLNASLLIKAGNPKSVLVEEALNCEADAIFIGATSAGNRFERFLLGSVAAAVAARAGCSVEVVRQDTAI